MKQTNKCDPSRLTGREAAGPCLRAWLARGRIVRGIISIYANKTTTARSEVTHLHPTRCSGQPICNTRAAQVNPFVSHARLGSRHLHVTRRKDTWGQVGICCPVIGCAVASFVLLQHPEPISCPWFGVRGVGGGGGGGGPAESAMLNKDCCFDMLQRTLVWSTVLD